MATTQAHTLQDWLSESDSRETSETIMKAIWQIALGNPDRAEQLWEDPDGADLAAIKAEVSKSGIALDHLVWGASGTSWASY
jgi:hypothetical protein